MSDSALKGMLLSKTSTKRFFESIDVPTTKDGCWNWTGPTIVQGYGHFFCGVKSGKIARVHRLAYEVWKGPIPESLTIDHLCYNRLCVNPLHLEAVTRGENAGRAKRKITHCPKGHEYTIDNIKTTKRTNGERACLTCHRERERAKRNRLRLEKAEG
jgi:hypothetical protein